MGVHFEHKRKAVKPSAKSYNHSLKSDKKLKKIPPIYKAGLV